MKKILFLLCMFAAVSLSAQKIEFGALVGGGIGFPMQDSPNQWVLKNKQALNYNYTHKLKGNALIGYRFRFSPAQGRSFYDLDLTAGLQNMKSHETYPYYESVALGRKEYSEFIVPLSITASWNYKFTEKFHAGVGVAPTLYVQPQAVFDVAVLAKVGYRVSEHCELGLSYQYGCLDVMKHFNDGPALGRQGHFSDLMFSVYVPFSIKN